MGKVLGRIKGKLNASFVELDAIEKDGNIIKFALHESLIGNSLGRVTFYTPDMVELYKPIDWRDYKRQIIKNILPTIIENNKDRYDNINIEEIKIKIIKENIKEAMTYANTLIDELCK